LAKLKRSTEINHIDVFKAELKKRLRVLRKFQHINEDHVLLPKGPATLSALSAASTDLAFSCCVGSVACEIESSVDEVRARLQLLLFISHPFHSQLIVTELIFEGVMNDLTPAHICSLLSCFFTDMPKTKKVPVLKPEGEKAYAKLQEIAKNVGALSRSTAILCPLSLPPPHPSAHLFVCCQVAKVSKECGLPIEEEKYCGQFLNIMMGITYEWCTGKSFGEICVMTDMFEGSIIRNFRRLEELLQYALLLPALSVLTSSCARQLRSGVAAIGNTELEAKFVEASKLLKRGIIFAASLYI